MEIFKKKRRNGGVIPLFVNLEMPAQGGHDIQANYVREYLSAFLFSIRFVDVHEGGGKRVIGDEGGGKADDGE